MQSEETSGGEAGPESEEDGTETEREKTPAPEPRHEAEKPSVGKGTTRTVHVRGGPAKIQGVMESARRAQQAREEYARTHPQESQEGGASTTGAKLRPEEAGEASKRRSLGESADLSSSTTDSEWEKVSEGGDR